MKTRKGLSSIVGTVFAIIALTTAISYTAYSMNLLEKFNHTIFVKTIDAIDRGNEEFKITKASIINNKFNITVQNTGSIPVHITRIWIENKTTSGSIFKYDINTAVTPGRTANNIGQNIPLTALITKSYNVKLVTERGNVEEFLVNSASAEPLHLQLFALPAQVPNGFKTTLLFAVTNNMSNNGALTNLKPNLVAEVPTGASAPISGPEPESYPVLERGDTAYFMYTSTLSGSDGQVISYTANLQNPYPGNSANADVKISTILDAQQSQTALISKGLATAKTSDDVLIFHKETDDALGGRQMYSVGADNGQGEIIQLDTTIPNFFTNNDTVNVTIPRGTWNATIRYLSNSVPDTLISNLPNLIYHFEDGNPATTARESSLNNYFLTLPSAPNKPTYSDKTSGGYGSGPNGTGMFHFDGTNDYMYRTVQGGISDIQNHPDTTAGWFKTSSSTGRQVIVRMGDQGDAKEFYEISMNNGQVQFRFSTKNNVIDGNCQTPTSYANGNWHHFVAVRYGSGSTNTCELYIDGGLKAGPNSASTGDDKVDVNGNWNVGKDPNVSCSGTSCNYFNGDLDDIIHWNNYQLTPSQITDLYKTSYGDNAHRVTFIIKKVDKNGLNPTSIASTNYPLKFMDGFGEYTQGTPSDTSWGQYNYTVYVPTSVILDDVLQERLKFNMTFIHQSNGELNLKMKIDDTDITNQLGNSFLQIPYPDKALPGYFAYNNGGDGIVNVYNSGPYGAWLTLNSRVVFETMDSTIAYGALLTSFDPPSSPAGKDSEYFQVGSVKQISFGKPSLQPGDSNNIIPDGTRYRMYVYLNGYDQKGNVFTVAQYIGVVKVI